MKFDSITLTAKTTILKAHFKKYKIENTLTTFEELFCINKANIIIIYYIPTNAPSLKHKSGLGNKPAALTVEAPAHFLEETFDFFKRHTATPFLSLNTSPVLPNYHKSSR